MASINKDHISRFEVSGVYTHPEAKVDIVLVHGLNGDPKRTWTASNKVFWPTDLLPESLKGKRANILVYGYNADVYAKSNDRSASDNFVFQHAQTLITHLTTYRKSEETMRNPIIWVAHSLGGILLKRALLYSSDVRNRQHEDFRSIYVSTYAIIFLGTPHTGSGLARWGHVLQAMSDVVLPKKFFESESILLKTLKKDNERLQEINNHFLDIYQRFHIHMAHESLKTDLKGTKTLVVDADSASPQLPGVTYYGIEATHSGMCKFDSVNAPGYRTVSTAIREWVTDAPPVIETRWEVETGDRQVRDALEIREISRAHQDAAGTAGQPIGTVDPHSQTALPSKPQQDLVPTSPLPLVSVPARPALADFESQDPIDPLFIVPKPFRPNSYFVGREAELDELHRKLMDPRRRSVGTSAVLIQCLPGGGKTHLARQYVFGHREDYPGGIYWVRAKSVQEMESWYWRIAKDEALRESMEDLAQQGFDELRDPRKIVDIVRKWFNSFEDWLLVFDGIHFDEPGLKRFIPDAKNTSIVFTSTERAVSGDYEFDNPQIMELGLLPVAEAQDLLLLEMEKRKPWTQDDRSRAHDLVELMGRLPLMIHVAAQHLKATREPLSKYLRSYKNRPRVGSLPAYRAVWDQLKDRGASAALNLMSILVFYDQHIPVEMLTLGLSALDSRTPVKTRDASRSRLTLNNTLKVLIAFALVERTETDEISSAGSWSSRKSFDRTAEYIDILRIHSVVQAFFIETLTEDKQHSFWLERSAAVFCRSFDEADKRIREDPRVGLPDDYRRYSIHGKRLLEHLNRLEKRGRDQLPGSRKAVEERYDQMREAIDRLSQTFQGQIVDGSGDVPSTSVFERASSSSELDSETPASQQSYTLADEWYAVADDDAQQYSSPTIIMPGESNPYHFHVPYPNQALIPSVPYQDEEDDATVSATPVPPHLERVERQEAPGISSSFSSPVTPRSGECRGSGPSHRTIKRTEARRYHDRAGAWRDPKVGDPRSSISRETAKGSIFRPRASTRPGSQSRMVTADSDAESTLNKIKRAAPPSPGASGPSFPEHVRTSSGTTLRPRLRVGRNSYANAQAGPSSDDDYTISPPNFSSGLSRVSSPPASWTAATLRRLHEGNALQGAMAAADQTNQTQPVFVPIAVPVAVPVSPDSQTMIAGLDARILNKAAAGAVGSPPQAAYPGVRTANSSPEQVFQPFDLPGLRVESNMTSSLHSVPGHHSTAGDANLVYRPGNGHIDASDLAHGIAGDAMSRSFPFAGPPYPYTLQVHPPAHPHGVSSPEGYTSEPMSRDPSAQSSSGHAATAGSVGSVPIPWPEGHLQQSRQQQQQQQRLSSLPSHAASLDKWAALDILPHPRSPSLVETEPSPRARDSFMEVDTSYARYEENHGGRRRSGSASLFTTSPVTARLFRRGGAAAAVSDRGRSRSQGPTRGPGGGRSPGTSSRGFATPPSVASSSGGEAMSRSGSGGIRLGDGRVIQFGSSMPPHEVEAAVGQGPQLRRGGGGSSASMGSDGGVGLGISQH